MQMSALDTDCTSGTGKIHAFTLNFNEIGSWVPSLYAIVLCHVCSAPDIYGFQSHLSLGYGLFDSKQSITSTTAMTCCIAIKIFYRYLLRNLTGVFCLTVALHIILMEFIIKV